MTDTATPYELNTNFARAQNVFGDCLAYAQRNLSDDGVRAGLAQNKSSATRPLKLSF